jgi:hypothetical protein
VSGPAGTEQLGRDLLAALEAANYSIEEPSVDQPYVVGKPTPTFAKPGPSTRAEYARLVALRHRFSQRALADSVPGG